MLRSNILQGCRRFYHHDSNFKQRLPTVKLASARARDVVRKRLDYESQPRVPSYDPSKRFEPFPFAVTEENKVEVLRRIITPLYNVPYEEQLSSKETYCRNALRHLAQELYRSGTPVRLDVRRLPCHVNPIVKSEQLNHYRNKDEFSIWRGVDGKTETVGFMAFPIGKHGDTVCIEPNGCQIMKEEAIKLSDILQDFIRHQAKLPVCYSLGTQGGWRRFIIRTNSEGELMLIGVASPRTLTVQQVLDERENFKKFVVERASEVGLKLSSLYFQPCPHNKCLHKDVPFELLYGKQMLEDTINGHKFVLSPDSHLPQSINGSEILYDTIKKTINDCFSYEKTGKKPLVIDASCGVGVLSIHLADLASKVIGIDISSQSIEDARYNAKLNNIDNIEFICAQPEIVLERVLEKNSQFKNETLVVCNPPKTGLHQNTVDVLRGCREVNKIVYVTPAAGKDSIIENLLTLCKKTIGRSTPPFVPVSATPVDVYPQVESCEFIIALERSIE